MHSALGADTYYPLNDSKPLKEQLFSILSDCHKPDAPREDILSKTCKTDESFRHLSLGYKPARKLLFGFLFLDGTTPDTYSLMTSYCQVLITNDDLSASDPLSPLNIPDFHVINAEHTWPQSMFSKTFPEDIQKSDLHILLPELSSINTLRSNHPFGHAVQITHSPCPEAKLGKNANGRVVFEPHPTARGNVARALFYFSTRYKMAIDKEQEDVLRSWHMTDPVDAHEEWKNEQIFQHQNNRNPFIDHPEWVTAIDDF